MSLAMLGTAANIFGVMTPAKDVFDVLKGIAVSIQEGRQNRESVSYWSDTLKDYIKAIDLLIARCEAEGTEQLRLQSLFGLLKDLILIRKELHEIALSSGSGYIGMIFNVQSAGNKISVLERKVKQCQVKFMADALSLQTSILTTMEKRQLAAVANTNNQMYIDDRTAMWKTPGKIMPNTTLVVEYAFLAKKADMLLRAFNLKAGFIQSFLYCNRYMFESKDYRPSYSPVGNPQTECEDASQEAIRLYRVLLDEGLDSRSVVKWLDDLSNLSHMLHDVGLTKESRQIYELMCRIWISINSDTGSAPVYSRLALSLHNVAAAYINEDRNAEALPLIERAIQVHRSLRETTLPGLATCLRLRSGCLRSLCRFEDALESSRESVNILERMVEEDFKVYGIELVQSLTSQAGAYNDLSQCEAALQCSSAAMQWLSKLSPQYEQVYPDYYAWTTWNIEQSHYILGHRNLAKEYGRKALKADYGLIRDRPLYYTYTFNYAIVYCYRIDCEEALPVLDESLIVCRTVDQTFIDPQLFDILDQRAYILMSCKRYREALESYNQALDIRHRLDEDDEAGDLVQFGSLLRIFRLRASCLLHLRRHRDAELSLNAAQDVIVSRLKSEIDKAVMELTIQELQDQLNLLKQEEFAGPGCTDLISLLKNFKNILSAIHRIKSASHSGRTFRSDLGRFYTTEYQIHVLLGNIDIAILIIEDAVDFYRVLVAQKHDQSARVELVTSLISHAHFCEKQVRLEEAFNSTIDAVRCLRADLDNKVYWGTRHLPEIVDLYFNISDRLVDRHNDHEMFCHFLKEAVESLRSAIMSKRDIKAETTLASLLAGESRALFILGLYHKALSAAEESFEIRRRLMAQRDISSYHRWDLAYSFYWHAKALLAIGDANNALASTDEGINTFFEIKQLAYIPDGLRDLLYLRNVILLCLGRAPSVHDALLESLLLEI